MTATVRLAGEYHQPFSALWRFEQGHCFSLVLAQDNQESILLTGDAVLRTVATAMGCEVHGAIWVTDEICRCGLLPDQHVAKCLQAWLDDDLVRLPSAELTIRLHTLTKK